MMGPCMKSLVGKIRRFLLDNDGPTAAEYAIVLVLVFMVCFTAIRLFGQKASGSLQRSSDSIGSVAGSD
jgi:pilus assembly protein Flp/PilA